MYFHKDFKLASRNTETPVHTFCWQFSSGNVWSCSLWCCIGVHYIVFICIWEWTVRGISQYKCRPIKHKAHLQKQSNKCYWSDTVPTRIWHCTGGCFYSSWQSVVCLRYRAARLSVSNSQSHLSVVNWLVSISSMWFEPVYSNSVCLRLKTWLTGWCCR